MPSRETLRDGAVRFRAAGCAFVLTRLAPRALLVAIQGTDDGQLGSAVLGEMGDEIDRFGPPLRVFADARAARGVAGVVQDEWQRWFSAQKARLAGVDVLVPHALVQLAVSTVRHLSRASDRMQITGDAGAFEAVIRAVVPEFAGLPSDSRFAEPPADVRRRTEPDGMVHLEAGRCSFEYRRPRSGLVRITIAGHDDGALGAAPLDELRADLRDRPGRLTLFVDARDTRAVATHVRDLWSAWFQAHREELEAVHVLSAAPLVQLNLGLGRQLSRTGGLMRLHTDAAAFDRALAEASGR